MKVLSLTEPFATLIKEKKKFIETRSWKTNYRGPLYIHASMTKVSKKDLEDVELMSLVEDKKMNFGKIICKCNLIDCVYMTEKFVNDTHKNKYQEYVCGDYSVGRYAWILENIEPLDTPINAKGQLNIWNYYNEYEVINLMEDIKYGWLDKSYNKHIIVDKTFSKDYILQSPKEVLKNKIGICWDQVELERYFFKGNDWNIKTYFLVHYDNQTCPTHTFLTFEKNEKYYWFEHSWEKFRGIHEYNSLKELLWDIRNKFIKYELNNNYDNLKLVLHEYKKPKYHISVPDFYKYCDSGEYIDYNKL